VGSDDGHLYSLNRETGALVWRYRTGDAIAAGPTVADEKLYVGSIDRQLHAFTLKAE
jgi:outer membrane protein assembly factor BamB